MLALAAEQHGVLARRQVLAAGGDDALVRRRLRSGVWVRPAPGVYELAGLPDDPERRLWTAWLAVGPHAVVSHETAAQRRGLGPVPTGRLVFTTAHGDHHRIPGVVVHQLRDVLPHHVGLVDGLPTTTAARTIMDLAAVSSDARLLRIVEEAVRTGRTTDLEIAAAYADIARPGKWGANRMLRVLARRGPRNPVPDSKLERLLLAAIRAAGLPEPLAQFTHPGRSPVHGCVDFAYPDARLILEADGRSWHQRQADLKRDRARDNEAARAGWLTLRFMWEELTHDPADVAATIVETRAHRLAA